ncbi:MAG: DUF4184 family protein [Candidatus Bathyarchaeota archaeon]|nr:DUF4184 family protein [Candidatus Bathyarchaeota archaeon]MDW8040931.1 DUF4184 family protein [Nitrososphaerota archaeon]
MQAEKGEVWLVPLTPFHPLAFLFLYFRDKKRIDPLALAVSTTFIDLESLYYIVLSEPLDHRLWHGFTLALTVYPILVALGVYLVERFFENWLLMVYGRVKLSPVKVRYPLWNIYLLSLLGGFSHVFLDMFTHPEMFWVLYPFIHGNPFYTWQAAIAVDITVVALSVYSLTRWRKNQKDSDAKFGLTQTVNLIAP